MVHRQQGFLLLQFAVLAVLATLGAIWGVAEWRQRVDASLAQASAVWMLSVRTGVSAYLQTHAQTLSATPTVAPQALAGFQDWRRPSLEELRQAGLLKHNLPATDPLGQGVDIRVFRQADCPGPLCALDAVMIRQAPFKSQGSGTTHEALAAQWLLASQGLGGSVWSGRAGRLAGASFDYPNPPVSDMAGLPPGTVAMAVSHRAGQTSVDPAEPGPDIPYLEVGDTRDPQFQGPMQVAGEVDLGAALQVADHVVIAQQVVAHSACHPLGALARDSLIGLSMCTPTGWTPLQRMAGGYSLHSRWGCQADAANLVTGTCMCPMGFVPVRIADNGPLAGAGEQIRGYLCLR